MSSVEGKEVTGDYMTSLQVSVLAVEASCLTAASLLVILHGGSSGSGLILAIERFCSCLSCIAYGIL